MSTQLCCFFFALIWLAACSQPPAVTSSLAPLQVQLTADGRTLNLTTQATTVRELLAEASIELGELDEVVPPLFTPLQNNQIITVTRVSESLEVVSESIPFEREFMRTDTMSADDPPQIVRPGQPGLKEVTVRIIYRDGLEAGRVRTNEVILEAPQNEVVLIGIGANRGTAEFPGLLAYISGGAPVLMRGTTAVPEQLPITGQLDGRVFALSPSGSHLLYTQVNTDTTDFNNTLWVINTERNATPIPLEVENVLWANWNPAAPISDTLTIAYTTAEPSSQPPGWEANNDLWLGTIPLTLTQSLSNTAVFSSTRLSDLFPALNPWWGGNYAWSPDGQRIAYSFANEVGQVNLTDPNPIDNREQLQRFTPYNTNSDWVWIPSLTWSPDGRFLAFTNHGGSAETTNQFDSWVLDTTSPLAAPFISQTGMWGHLFWSPANNQVAYLQATDQLDSLRSNYTLWLMDTDGSNPRQIYPPVGENSAFSRDQSALTWGPDGQQLAFIFDDDLFLLTLPDNSVIRVTQDDTRNSNPTWAPYGYALQPEPADDHSRRSTDG